jgi:putative endonuclease
MDWQPCVYILARASHGTFYIGVTSNLLSRIWQHREEAIEGFTKRYGIKRLVWFEVHETMEQQSFAKSASSDGRVHGSTT